MFRFLILAQSLKAQFVSNPNYVLYDRLMNNYRVDFIEVDDTCNRTEWESSLVDVPTVPRLVLKSFAVDSICEMTKIFTLFLANAFNIFEMMLQFIVRKLDQ